VNYSRLKLNFNIRFIANVNGDTVEDFNRFLINEQRRVKTIVILMNIQTSCILFRKINSNCYLYSGDIQVLIIAWKEIASEVSFDLKNRTLDYSKRRVRSINERDAVAEGTSVSGSTTL
jgi:hypothetical protein